MPSSSKKPPVTVRSSFFSRILHLLLPCISPQSTSHIVELDSQTPLQEKFDSKPTVQIDEVLPKDTTLAPVPLTADLTIPTLVTSSSSRPPTPFSEHAEEVVPTPTTHLLPQDETAGMTSGAVQPPGSKGDSPTVEKSHSSPPNGDGDESEGTSYTEEDLEEQEDDEDRLIFNGGAGIPTGPVSSSHHQLSLFSPFYPIQRTAFPNPFFHPYRRITQVGNALYLISMKLWYTAVSRSVSTLV
jgi:RNA polymerase II subunit A small phosphatase-like protein